MVEVQGGDYISTRLSGKVLMNDGPAAEGWDLADWVEWWLRHWGYNGTFTPTPGAPSVTISLPTDLTNPALPPPRYTGEPMFWFDRDSDGLAALDAVLRAYRWMPLAVTNTGTLTTGPDPLRAGWSGSAGHRTGRRPARGSA